MSKPGNTQAHHIYGFHIARAIRERDRLDESYFGADGRVFFPDVRSVREFVYNFNRGRPPEEHIFPGEVNAAGLLEEIGHLLIRAYEERINPGAFSKFREELLSEISEEGKRALLVDFVEHFPPADVYGGRVTPGEYLSSMTGGRPNADIVLEEMILLHFDAINPANRKIQDFFDPSHLSAPDGFQDYIDRAERFFEGQPLFSGAEAHLLGLLRAPLLASPGDLSGQLDYILTHWKSHLPDDVVSKILTAKDLIREDILLSGGSGGESPSVVPDYKGAGPDAGTLKLGRSGYQFAVDAVHDYAEYENFSLDANWMPKVVMLAKNTYVWLDQLSKKYKREIRRLDQIPDEELDQLARWNINGLWLIGVWERSTASKRIKHIMGNIDAVSSAYSLYDYEIAADLGGEWAFQDLNRRARERGIRLAGDMVPNHTGIYSRWMIERPGYFIQCDHPPFPSYSFTGENLCPVPHVEIRIDDGYYSRSDAAVVFQRIDRRTGEVRYIYHGNDGTMMPWNDTAQLDFLKQEVREAVIQKVFDVARKFSIIRFDAAMTLAKKHFSRLWYPRPGSGGDIASRSEHAMSQQAFDELFPHEFWREVVDRVKKELPGTLLLAEAFWLMEGYFVRTLGMHRVYNSAFMHMLKKEENEKYRDLISNTLEFEPEILKRYVNFMNNPDEETAISQFGTGDKYFGICVLMTTLPGLPMFGHGQVEGFTEKYGMEYQRAYYDETPEQWLVEKHEREVFPLAAKRYLFGEITHFNLFDYLDEQGNVNENVIAYANMHGHERAIVLFNNKYDTVTGKIEHASPKLDKESGAAVALSLGQALQINPTKKMYYIVREHISGLDYLFSGEALHRDGLRWPLQGFEYRVFIDFREVYDESGAWESLHRRLNGRGFVPGEIPA